MTVKTKTHHIVDGVKYSRVTSIINILDKPFLKYWYGNNGIEKCQELIDESTTFGSGVHNCFESMIAKGHDIAYLSQYDRQVNAFKKWSIDNHVNFLESERAIYNHQLKYCGTLDSVAMIGHEMVLIDFKTSKAIYKEQFMQLAAYWKAYESETKETINKAIVLRFEKDKMKKEDIEIKTLKPKQMEEYYELFLACLKLFKAKEEKLL